MLMEERVAQTKGIVSALLNVVLNDVGQDNELEAGDHPNTITAILHIQCDKLCYQNSRLEKLIMQLSERIGKAKIV